MWSLSPDDAGYTGLSGQQRQHGVVTMALLQTLLAWRLGLWPLAVEEGHGDVAVGVLVAERGQRRQGASGGQVVVVATVIVFLPHLGVARVVEGGGAQVRVRRRHGGGGCGRHRDGRDGLQLAEGALLADVQYLLVGDAEGLHAFEGHLVEQLLPELGVELVAGRAAPLDDRQHFDGVFEGLHFLVVHDATQLGALDQDDFDLARHQHVAQPRFQLKDTPPPPHHVAGRHNDDEAFALVHTACHVLDVRCAHRHRDMTLYSGYSYTYSNRTWCILRNLQRADEENVKFRIYDEPSLPPGDYTLHLCSGIALVSATAVN